MTVQIEVQYRPRPGHGLSQRDADIIGPELERISEQGKATPKEIVDQARPEDSPLHPYFNWNDDSAAEAYRRWQARQLSRSIIIEVATDKGRSLDAPAFYSVARSEDDELDREYVPIGSLLEDPVLVLRQLMRFKRDLERIRSEYAVFGSVRGFNQVAGPVLEAINKTLDDAA